MIRTHFPARQPGQTLTEYGLLLGLIAIGVIAVAALLGGSLSGLFGDTNDALNGDPAGGNGGGTTITGTSPQPGTGGSLSVSIENMTVTSIGGGNVRVQAEGVISGGTFVQWGWYAYAGESFSAFQNTINVDFEMPCAELADWGGNPPSLGLGATDYPSEDDWMMAMNMGEEASDTEQLPYQAEVPGC